MFGYKSPDIIVAEVKMLRAMCDCAVLLIEGPHDEKFWLKLRAPDCELVIAEGKPNVLGSIHQLDREGYVGVLGLVDDDFDCVLEIHRPSPNLVATDASDLECLLCRSCALEDVLFEHGEQIRIRQFEERAGTSVRGALLDRALVFGRLRWAERQFGFEVCWKLVGGVQRFLCEDSWELDENALIGVVSSVSGLDQVWLVDRIRSLPKGTDPWFIARGRDLVDLLRIGLRGALGRIKATVGKDEVSSALRLAFTRPAFEATGLAREIRDWETRNTPYAILPA